MKIVQLSGGIGNQMFQFAFVKAIESRQSDVVLFDKDTWFYKESLRFNKKTGLTDDGRCKREFELGIFKLPESLFAKEENICQLRKKSILPKAIRKIFGIGRYKFLVKERKEFCFDEELLNIKTDAYYEGFFQNELYFNNIRDVLLDIFQFPNLDPSDVENIELLNSIENSDNSVFIHVRREDYVNLNMTLSLDYYKKAVEKIYSLVKKPHFYVFCAEDPSYIRDNFKFLNNYELVGIKNNKRNNYWVNMLMMSKCKHAIIANSSYSWWGAWLIKNKNKFVLAPSPWLFGEDNVICEDWIKIKYKLLISN